MSNANLLNLAPKFLDTSLTPIAQEIGKTLGNIFYTIFSPINYNVEKLRIRQSENLKKFEEDIKNELNKIPEKDLIEPQLSIIGPALEASKYYIEHGEMRKMFAKLIAASMNELTNNKAHHSFVEIIKQLSPLDACNLEVFSNKTYLPIVIYRAKLSSGTGGVDLIVNAFLSNPQNKNHEQQGSSITNLHRLGLINVDYSEFLIGKDAYLDFENYPFYILNNQNIKQHKKQNSDYMYKSIEIKKGKVGLTFVCVMKRHNPGEKNSWLCPPYPWFFYPFIKKGNCGC